jgi:hypothetical protein
MEKKTRLLLTCGRNRRDSMEERVALLVAPVGMRESADYFAAFRLAEDRHPDQRIVPDAELWSTAKEFAQTYKKWLGCVAVSNFYILTAPDGTIGQGIFNMWSYLRKHQQSKTTALFPIGGNDFEEIADCELAVIGSDTGRFAVPVESVPVVPR